MSPHYETWSWVHADVDLDGCRWALENPSVLLSASLDTGTDQTVTAINARIDSRTVIRPRFDASGAWLDIFQPRRFPRLWRLLRRSPLRLVESCRLSDQPCAGEGSLTVKLDRPL